MSTRQRVLLIAAFVSMILLGAILAHAQPAHPINPHTQIKWPPSCTGSASVYNIITNQCQANGTAANPAGINNNLQCNIGGSFAPCPSVSADGANGLAIGGSIAVGGNVSTAKIIPNAITAPPLYTRPMYLFADSRGFGVGASSYAKSYAALLADSHGGPFYNKAVSGDLAADETVWIAQNIAPLADISQGYPISVISTGVNNANTCGVTAACQNLYTANMMAAVALAGNLPAYRTLAPSCTLTGSWSSESTNYAPYIGKVSTTNADSFSCAITTTGNPIGLEYNVTFSTTGTANCNVDGGSNVPISFGSSVVVGGHHTFGISRTEFGAIAAGAHTLACTITSSTGAGNPVEFIAVDSLPTGQSATLPPVVVTNIPSIGGVNDSATATFSGLVSSVYSTYLAEGANITFVDARTPLLNTDFYDPASTDCPTNSTSASGGLHFNDCGAAGEERAIVAAAPTLFQERSAPKSTLGTANAPVQVLGSNYRSTTQYFTPNFGQNIPGPTALFGGYCVWSGTDCWDLAPAPTSPFSFILPGVGANGFFSRFILQLAHPLCFVGTTLSVTSNAAAGMPNLCITSNGDLFGFMNQNGNTPTKDVWHPYVLSFDDQISKTYGQTSNVPDLSHTVNYVGPLTSSVSVNLPGNCWANNSALGFVKSSPLLILIRQGTDGLPVTFTGGTNNTINTNAGGTGTSYTWTAQASDVLLLQCSTQQPSSTTIVAQTNWTAMPLDSTHNLQELQVGQTFIGSVQNLVSHSTDLVTSWSNTSGFWTVTTGQADPFGGTNAIKLVSTTTVENLYVNTGTTLTNATTYCWSAWVKGGTGGETGIALGYDNQGVLVNVTNAWNRVAVNFTTNGFALASTFAFRQIPGQGSQTLYLSGPQVNQGVCPGPYVATSANAVPATAGGLIPFLIASNLSLSATQTAVSCSTSGSATFSQPLIGGSDKKVLVHLAACNGTASYTFPTAFINTPGIFPSSTVAAGLVTALSATATTITGTTSTGTIVLEDF